MKGERRVTATVLVAGYVLVQLHGRIVTVAFVLRGQCRAAEHGNGAPYTPAPESPSRPHSRAQLPSSHPHRQANVLGCVAHAPYRARAHSPELEAVDEEPAALLGPNCRLRWGAARMAASERRAVVSARRSSTVDDFWCRAVLLPG